MGRSDPGGGGSSSGGKLGWISKDDCVDMNGRVLCIRGGRRAGWWMMASWWYAFLISAAVAVKSTPAARCDDPSRRNAKYGNSKYLEPTTGSERAA